MIPKSVHHVAYRCKGCQGRLLTFIKWLLDLDYTFAVAGDTNPTTGKIFPTCISFSQIEDGSYLAFFELPEAMPLGRDQNTPEWVQHLALNVDNMDALFDVKAKLGGKGDRGQRADRSWDLPIDLFLSIQTGIDIELAYDTALLGNDAASGLMSQNQCWRNGPQARRRPTHHQSALQKN